jgi:hypothetical protein
VRVARPSEGDRLVGLDRIEAAEVVDASIEGENMPDADPAADTPGDVSP